MSTDRQRLGTLAKARRLELGRTQKDVARFAGIRSDQTIRKIEDGTENVREGNLWKLDRGLDWQPGSSVAILAGDDPIEAEALRGAPPNYPPAYVPADVVERHKPVPGERLTHPEDLEVWAFDKLGAEERRLLIGYRRALRAGDTEADRQTGRD